MSWAFLAEVWEIIEPLGLPNGLRSSKNLAESPDVAEIPPVSVGKPYCFGQTSQTHLHGCIYPLVI
jgi:hypothetical protein